MLIRPLLRRRLIRYWEQKGKGYSAAILATLFALLHTAISVTPLGIQLEFAVVDRWFEIRGARPAPEEILVATIDERSFSALGESTLLPMPRKRMAEALNKLRDSAVKGVFIDIVFAERSDNQETEAMLAEALSSVKSFIAVGDISDGNWHKPLSSTENDFRLRPLPIFLKAASGILAVDIPTDRSVIRRFPHAVALFCQLLDESKILKSPLTTCPGRTDMLNYVGPPHSFKEISFSEILQQNFPIDHVKDKFVYIGLSKRIGSGLATKDTFATPYRNDLTAGVEIQATVLENIIRKNWIKRSPIELESPILAVICFLTVIVLFSINASAAVLLGLVAPICWLVVSYNCFLAGLLLPGASFFVLVIPTLVLLLIMKKLFAGYLNQRRYHSTFGNSL